MYAPLARVESAKLATNVFANKTVNSHEIMHKGGTASDSNGFLAAYFGENEARSSTNGRRTNRYPIYVCIAIVNPLKLDSIL